MGRFAQKWSRLFAAPSTFGYISDPGEQGRNPEVDFCDKPRSNDTHQSSAD
jgi:hypothetical protein